MCTSVIDTCGCNQPKSTGGDFLFALIGGALALLARALWWLTRRVVVPLVVLLAVASYRVVRALCRAGWRRWRRRRERPLVLVGEIVDRPAITVQPDHDMRWSTVQRESAR